MRSSIMGIVLLILAPILAAQDRNPLPPPVSTFSIVARDPATGHMGVAVASRYFAVGSVVPWAEANVGAVATQANVNVGYGRRGLELLRAGLTAQQVVRQLLGEDTFPGKEGRQIGIVDAKGNVETYTGPNAPNWAGGVKGATWAAQGNILVGPEVPAAMGKAFESTQGELAEKMFAALKAGDAVGGDKRGRQSASILIVCDKCARNTNNDRYVYINVDDNPDPFPELRRLLDIALVQNYQGRAYQLFDAGKVKEAREAAEKTIRYSPNNPGGHMSLGYLNYMAGDKEGALAEFRKARDLNPDFRNSWESAVKQYSGFKRIVEDKEFLKKLFPDQ